MATSGKKLTFLGVLMAELFVAATAGAVTVHNPAMIPLDLLTNNISVIVETGIVSLNFTGEEQKINISTLTGSYVTVDVMNGEVVVVLPPLLEGFLNFPNVQLVQIPFDFSQAAAVPSAESPAYDQSQDSEVAEP